MKQILLFLSLFIFSVTAFTQGQTPFPCVKSYKGNNGGGNCPTLASCGGQTNVVATGSISLTLNSPAGSIPTIIGVTANDPSIPQSDLDAICFGPGTLSNNGTVATYCYYEGGNKVNNLFGGNVQYTFQIQYSVNGQPTDCVQEIPTPVTLKSFSAIRQQSLVSINWVTSSESINEGFDVQRLNGTNIWETIAFVPSQAKDGFSNIDISYSYNDFNSNRNITQYRLIQNDFDGKQTYSSVRAVQGLSQAGRIIVSPNPVRNGQTNVIFENATDRRNLQLTDMVGRVVKQWNNYADNSLQLTNLVPGMYQLRIVNAATGAQSVEKIMVSGN